MVIKGCLREKWIKNISSAIKSYNLMFNIGNSMFNQKIDSYELDVFE